MSSQRKQKAKSMRKAMPLSDWLIIMAGLKSLPNFDSSFAIQKLYIDIGNDIKAEDSSMVRNYAPNKIDLAALGEVDQNEIRELASLSITATQMQDSGIVLIKRRLNAKLALSEEQINEVFEDTVLNPEGWTQEELDYFNEYSQNYYIAKAMREKNINRPQISESMDTDMDTDRSGVSDRLAGLGPQDL